MSFPKGIAVLVILWLLLGVACEKDRSAISPEPAASETSPQRIVSLAPSTTETLFALGAGARVVGVTRYCDHPPEARERAVVGGLTDVDVEFVLSLRPDLVIGVDSQTAAPLKRTLDAAGVRSRFLKVETFEDVRATIVEMGRIVDNEPTAARIVSELDSKRVPAGPNPPRVLVLFGREPWIAAGPGTFADEMVRVAGGRNALADIDTEYPMLDVERLMTVHPDLVIDTSFGDVRSPVPGNPNVVRLDPGLIRPGPRLAEALDIFATNIAAAGEQ